MIKKTAVHIYLSTFKNESRIIKQTAAMIEDKIVDSVLVLAVWDNELLERENFGLNRNVIRIRTRIFSGVPPRGFGRIVRFLRFIELLLRIIKITFKDTPTFINIHQVKILPLVFFFKMLLPSSILIYDTHELETETNGLEGLEKKLYKLYEKIFIKFFKHVFVVSPSIEEWYKRQYKISNVTTVRNCPNFEIVQKKDLFRYTLKIGKEVKIYLYQGALFKGRGIETLIEVFKQLEEDKYCIVFMGYGECEDIIKKASLTYKNIFFHDAVSATVVLEYTSSADFGIAMIENVCLSYQYCLPNKIFEYLMAGLPCIVSNLPDMRNYMHKYNVGLVSNDNSVVEIIEAVKRIALTDMKQFNKNIIEAQKETNWQIERQKMLGVYRNLKI